MTISKITVHLSEFDDIKQTSWYQSFTNVISLTYNYAFSSLSYWKNNKTSINVQNLTLDIKHSDNPLFIVNRVHDIVYKYISEVCIPTNTSITDHNTLQYGHMLIEIIYIDQKNNQYNHRYSYDYQDEKLSTINKLNILKQSVDQATEIISDELNLETHINVVQLDIGFDKHLYV